MKRLVSILLAVVLFATAAISVSAAHVWPDGQTADEAVKAYEAVNGEIKTHRYFFQMPDGVHGWRGSDGTTVAGSWYNDYSEGAGVYWWGGPAACDGWAGYKAMVADADQHIYYVDMPADTVCFIWNNGVDGGKDETQPYFTKAAQTIDVACEYPDPGEYESIPEGADNFDNCIFIINPDNISINDYSGMPTCGGTWFFYYGDGCYGSYAEGSANFVSKEDNCLNPDHNHGAPAAVRGDYNNNGDVEIMDATKVQRFIAELDELPDEAFLKAVDADGDGDMTVMDATRIQRFIAELCNMDGTTPYVAPEA